MSAAVMLFGKYVKWERIYRLIPQTVVMKIASVGLGIYVVHLFFIMVGEKIHIFGAHVMYFTVIMPFLIYGISLAVVLLLKKIPVIRKIVP